MLKRIFSFLFILLFSVSAFAQMTQNIKGLIVDKQTQAPLMGATILVLEHPSFGSVTDMDGYYKVEGVPTGRISLKINYLGYNEIIIPNIQLTSTKELVLDLAMEEMVVKGMEVVIQADKTKALNERATNSARTFSVEETKRYAGSLNDVSRMAANFAGINNGSDASNDVVIRGNSPSGLLWRLEGVDIPSPNHFSQAGATGGPISMLNNNTLSNSDFITGAFPSEYGNALSGAFDLNMRNGNNDNYEFMGQIGFNGFEFGAEGPISRKHKSSFLVNGRYSTLGVLYAMGMEFGTGSAIPQYSDLSFKLNFPSKKIGRIEIFGLGGVSNIDFVESEKEERDTSANYYAQGEQDIYSYSNTGVIGAKHTYLINDKTYSKLTLAATGFVNGNILDNVDSATREPSPYLRGYFENVKLFGSFYINRKLNAKNSFRVGTFATQHNFMVLDSFYSETANVWWIAADFSGTTYLLQPYINWQFKLTDNLTMNTGLHAMYLTLNGSQSLEPRWGLKYQMTEKTALSLAYGGHSQMIPIKTYFRTRTNINGNLYRPNENLDFVKASHYVFGIDHNFSGTLRLKTEFYYQDIYNAVIDHNSNSFSMMNSGSFTFNLPDSVRNGGTGHNYGVEFTFEKFLDQGFYYLATLSLYESKYKGADNVERNTAFNGNYVGNFLLGKEFLLGSSDTKKHLLVADIKYTHAGGQRYVPVDVELSKQFGETVYDYNRVYEDKFKDYLRIDTRVAYRQEGKKIAQEWAFDVQNTTNRKNIQAVRWNVKKGEFAYIYQRAIFPMFQYKIEF